MLKSQKHLFSLPDEVHYLNCAYMSPLPKSSEYAGIEGVKRKTLPYLIKADDFFGNVEVVKSLFAQLIGASESSSNVIIPSVSYGMSIVTNNIHLERSDEIILVQDEFPSVVYPCQRLAQQTGATIITVERPTENKDRGKHWNESIVERITPKTKLVALSGVHWADGTLFDLRALRSRTNDVGALLVVDGTQFIGAYPFDIREIPVDALICACYKWLLGPYSTAMMFLGDRFNEGIPIEEGWQNRLHSENFANLVQYQPTYKSGMNRYGMGEQSNFALLPMLIQSLEYLTSLTPTAVSEYCANLTKPLFPFLEQFGCGVETMEWRAPHLFGIKPPAHCDLHHFTAEFAHRNLYISMRGDVIRVSPNVYNTANDINALIRALEWAITQY